MKIRFEDGGYQAICALQAKTLDTPAAVNKVLDEIIDITGHIDELFMTESNGRKRPASFIQFEIEQPDGVVVTEDEFWPRVVESKIHDTKIHAYLRNLIAYIPSEFPLSSGLWFDEQTAMGAFASNALVRRDLPQTTSVRAYADFLCSNDMDHEVEQGDVIDEILEAVPEWNDDVLYLIAMRLSAAIGQHGSQLVEDDEEVLEKLRTHPHLDSLLDFMIEGHVVSTKPSKLGKPRQFWLYRYKIEHVQLLTESEEKTARWVEKLKAALTKAGAEITISKD